MVECEVVLSLEASDDTMKERLAEKAAAAGAPAAGAKSGSDANSGDQEKLAADLAANLASFHENQPPIVDHYDKQGKMHKVNAAQDPQAVFDEIKSIMNNENGMMDSSLDDAANTDKSKQQLS